MTVAVRVVWPFQPGPSRVTEATKTMVLARVPVAGDMIAVTGLPGIELLTVNVTSVMLPDGGDAIVQLTHTRDYQDVSALLSEKLTAAGWELVKFHGD
jgi:hypothetical protein